MRTGFVALGCAFLLACTIALRPDVAADLAQAPDGALPVHVGDGPQEALHDTGRRQYERLCANCHGADGRGGELGPAIVERLALRSDEQLATLVREGLPAAGMPRTSVNARDLPELVAFLRTLRPRRGTGAARVSVETTDGRTLHGRRLNHSSTDLQLLSEDGDVT